MFDEPFQPDQQTQSALEAILSCQFRAETEKALAVARSLTTGSRLYIADKLEEELCAMMYAPLGNPEELEKAFETATKAWLDMEGECAVNPALATDQDALNAFKTPEQWAVFILQNKGNAADPQIQCYVEELDKFSAEELNYLPTHYKLTRNMLEKLSQWPQAQAQRLAEQAVSKAAQERASAQTASKTAETQLEKLKKLSPKTHGLKRNSP